MKLKIGALWNGLPHGDVGSRILETRGRTTGFDYLRIFLASIVVLAHSRVVTYGLAAVTPSGAALAAHPPLFQPIIWAIVPSYFTVSGFLVAGSLMHAKSLFEFGMLRVLRIVPALLVQTVIAALVLGPLVTDLPLRDYFSDATLWRYALNIIGDIQYVLPGVFTHNAAPNIVNVQLWTIPWEWFGYGTLAFAFLLIAWISRLFLIKFKIGVGLITLGILVVLLAGMTQPHGVPQPWHAGGHAVRYSTLLLCFWIGVGACFYQEHIPLHFGLFLLSVVGAFSGMYDGNWQYLGVIPLAYAAIYFGLTNFPKTLVIAKGDYSYGLYLYGFPVQQIFAYLFPHNRLWELNFVVSLAVSMVLAVLSWHFLESRVLANRKAIIAATQNIFRFPLLNSRRSQPRPTVSFQGVSGDDS